MILKLLKQSGYYQINFHAYKITDFMTDIIQKTCSCSNNDRIFGLWCNKVIFYNLKNPNNKK